LPLPCRVGYTYIIWKSRRVKNTKARRVTSLLHPAVFIDEVNK